MTSELITVPAAGRMLEFEGELLGEVSTETPRQPRWLEIELYKLSDGTGRYVLHLCGVSLVYHVHDGVCNTGVPTTKSYMPLDAKACHTCHPVPVRDDDSDADTVWDLERDRHTTYVCSTPQEVIDSLHFPVRKKPGDDTNGSLSAPAQRLLELVAQEDPGFAEVMTTVQRL